jgi:hypothetical protein
LEKSKLLPRDLYATGLLINKRRHHSNWVSIQVALTHAGKCQFPTESNLTHALHCHTTPRGLENQLIPLGAQKAQKLDAGGEMNSKHSMCERFEVFVLDITSRNK